MATLFWVGGTATYNSTAGTKWSTSSGGASGAPAPTAADDVVFDGSSSGTVTLSSTSVARSIDCTGFTGTISHPASTSVSIGDGTAGTGNVALKLSAGMTYTLGSPTGQFSFISTSATVQTVTTAGQTMGNTLFNGAGGSWQLADGFSTSSTATITLTQGTLNTNLLRSENDVQVSPRGHFDAFDGGEQPS